MLNEQILKYRLKNNLTQKDIAFKLGVSERTVQNWESGKVIPKTKYEIIRKIITGEGEMIKKEVNNNYPEDLINFMQNTDTTKELLSYISELKEIIDNNKKEIEILREKNAIYEKRLEAYEHNKSYVKK